MVKNNDELMEMAGKMIDEYGGALIEEFINGYQVHSILYMLSRSQTAYSVLAHLTASCS